MEFVSSAEKMEEKPTELGTKILIRARNEGLLVVDGPPSKIKANESLQIGQDQLLQGNFSEDYAIAEFSQDGKMLALVNLAAGTVTVVNMDLRETVMLVERAAVQAASWSPSGRFLLTWNRPNKEENSHNLVVWEVASGNIHASFFQKSFKRDLWPTLQWFPDEQTMMKSTADELVIMDATGSVVERVSIPGIAKFHVAPAGTVGEVPVAVFIPEKKGKPAAVRIYQEGAWGFPLASKSFFRASECDILWNSRGSHIIVKTHTDVDATNQSYYGSTGLYMLATDGNFECQVPLTKEGPVGDVQWSPQGGAFVVTAGTMPAACTLYNTRCEAVFEFGQSHRNTVSWSPHGRFLCLAGFGNLAGGMDFWDVNKKKKMGSAESNCAVSYGWSPDSRYFMTATLSPRMNVDNGIKIFKYNGIGPVIARPIDQLYQATFAPAAPGVYPDRPQSPRPKGEQPDSPHQSPVAAPKKVGAYRPPHATGSLAAMMRAERESGSGAKKVTSSHRSIPGAVPGMAPPGSTPEKKKNRRRKKKNTPNDTAAAENGSQQQQEQGGVKKDDAVAEPAPAVPKDKKLKNLRKKLKQIEALKEKAAAGSPLNDDQKLKLTTEQETIDQIAHLEAEI